MLAVVTQGNGAVEVVDAPLPTIQVADDVIVKVTAAAICGTDLHFVREPFLPPTLALGHEFIGTVHDVGSMVTRLSIGDRVLAKMFVACGRCAACLTGNQPLCPEYQLFGGGVLPGGQAEFVRVPRGESTLSLIDEVVSDQDALVLTDILPTAWEALHTVRFDSGSTLGVVGGGPVGLVIALLAIARGAASVFVVDLDDRRLAIARQLGATTVSGGAGASERVLGLTGGRGVDAAVDAVGSASAIATAMDIVAVGGTVGLVGVLLSGALPLTAQNTFLRQVTVAPVTGNPYTANHRLTSMIAAGVLSPGRLLDHEAPLADAAQTYAAFLSRDIVKACLRP